MKGPEWYDKVGVTGEYHGDVPEEGECVYETRETHSMPSAASCVLVPDAPDAPDVTFAFSGTLPKAASEIIEGERKLYHMTDKQIQTMLDRNDVLKARLKEELDRTAALKFQVKNRQREVDALMDLIMLFRTHHNET